MVTKHAEAAAAVAAGLRTSHNLAFAVRDLQVGVGVIPPEVQARRKHALLLWFQRRIVRLAHIVHRLRINRTGPQK